MAGAYEREAIRPHVLGRFVDMLLAAEGHPAMLFYLDNARSMGPNSVAGINRDKGLNENLAREILELHTLGVRTGYTQEDVTSFAKVITGWTILPTGTDPDHGGEFLFNQRLHEPGAQTVIGKSLSRHRRRAGPRRARRSCAPSGDRDSISRSSSRAISSPTSRRRRWSTSSSRRFNDTDGDLKEVAKTLVTAPRILDAAARQAQAAVRMDRRRILRAAACAGDRRHAATCQGVAPGRARRAAMAAAGAERLPRRRRQPGSTACRIGSTSPTTFAAARARPARPDRLLDIGARPARVARIRAQTVARAESRPQALALLLMAPEFQRR